MSNYLHFSSRQQQFLHTMASSSTRGSRFLVSFQQRSRALTLRQIYLHDSLADSVGINCHESKDLLVFILINTISIVSISFSNKTKTLSQHGELQLSMTASWAYWPHNILQSPVKCLHLTPPGLSPSPHSQKLEKAWSCWAWKLAAAS